MVRLLAAAVAVACWRSEPQAEQPVALAAAGTFLLLAEPQEAQAPAGSGTQVVAAATLLQEALLSTVAEVAAEQGMAP